MKRFVLAFAALTIASGECDACTGIKLTAKDGTSVSGRTLEFGIPIEFTSVVVPRGYRFTGNTPNGKGVEYQSKYAAVGVFAFDEPSILDGLNEKGLSIGTFYFPGFAGYAVITSDNQSKALSPTEFPNWVLTQFATVDEVKAALSSVVIAPTVSKSWGTTPPPFHYLVIDKQGNGLAIEPIDGKLVAVENKLGVFTNSPTFDWHMTNLRNFINLTPFNVKPLTIDGLTLVPFGQGSGMVGLPGDFTPPSRFVRAAIFSITAVPSATAKEAVMQTFHILNNFDIPVGIAREVVDGRVGTDYTQVTCVRDPNALQYYFRTYDNETIKMVDLTQFDLDAKAIKQAPPKGRTPYLDISSELK